VTSVPDGTAVRTAARRVREHVRRTPVLRDEAIDALVGVPVYCKCEHLQLGGAFKLRGALNAVLARQEEAQRGVAAHSSGNHAAVLARAAAIVGVPCHVVIPEDAPRVKVEATVALGATVVRCGPGLDARRRALDDVLASTGAIEIHPYDDPDVIAGQGTATLELLEHEIVLTFGDLRITARLFARCRAHRRECLVPPRRPQPIPTPRPARWARGATPSRGSVAGARCERGGEDLPCQQALRNE
jgi:hypothetical protein